MDYIDLIKYGILLMVIVIGSMKAWEFIKEKTKGGNQKWESFLED